MAGRRDRRPTGTPAWIRLGKLLEARRAGLDPAYSGHGGRSAFARERGISLKMAQDIENNDRENFTAVTLRDVIAPAYAVTPESITAALEGGELEPLPQAPPPSRRPRMSGPPPGFPEATPEQYAYMVPYIAEIEDAVELARFRHPGEDLTGALVFPRSPRDQDLWDFFRKQDWPLEGMIWMLANSRAWDEQQADLGRKGRATGLVRT